MSRTLLGTASPIASILLKPKVEASSLIEGLVASGSISTMCKKRTWLLCLLLTWVQSKMTSFYLPDASAPDLREPLCSKITRKRPYTIVKSSIELYYDVLTGIISVITSCGMTSSHNSVWLRSREMFEDAVKKANTLLLSLLALDAVIDCAYKKDFASYCYEWDFFYGRGVVRDRFRS